MPDTKPALTPAQIDRFITDGFVRLDNAFSRETAEQARAILWADTGCDPNDKTTWTKPVVRLGGYAQRPFVEAANTPVLTAAYDQLVGPGNWLPRDSLGTFPVRFPSTEDPGDAGWHIDASFPGDDPTDIFAYRANLRSKGRALLMLFLFSDVGENDAPTHIRTGSHLDIACHLAPAGEPGKSLHDFIADNYDWCPHRPEVLATGDAGTVYLCHPFLVHGAQPNLGSRVKFMAQPPLLPRAEMHIDGNGPFSPVETATRMSLGRV